MLDKTFALLQTMGVDPEHYHADKALYDEAVSEVKLLRSMPEIVMLAGSSRFKQAFEQVAENLALQGKIVLGKSVYKPGDEWPLDERAKSLIHAIQFRICDLASRLHVVNVDGYVGQDTYNLIRYAMRTDRTVTFHEDRVRLLAKEGATVTAHHFLQATQRRVEFEEATSA
jgi:hypothetical protein